MKKSILALAPLFCIGAAPASPPDYSALCAGWEGKWRALDSVVRQDDGSWKTDMTDPGWRVKADTKGKCSFYSDPGNGSWFTVDITKGIYAVQTWDKGKPGVVTPYRFLRSEIVGNRTWQIDVLAPPTAEHRDFMRLSMVMAGDSFAIFYSKAPTEAGPFQLFIYAVHRRQPS